MPKNSSIWYLVLFSLLILGLLIPTGILSNAYTTGEIKRSTSINVVPDSEGVFSLYPNQQSKLVSTTPSGKLQLDTQKFPSGVEFTDGDTSMPFTDFTFLVTNKSPSSRTMTISYIPSAEFPENQPSAVTFLLYDSSGQKLGEIQANGQSQSYTLQNEESISIITVINTQDVDSGEQLTGKLKFELQQ